MADRFVRWIAAAIALLAVSAFAGTALGQEVKTSLTVLGFDKDYENMLVKIDDNNVGLALRLYSMETGKPAKRSRLIEYMRGQEVQTIKRAKRKYKIKDPGHESMKDKKEKLAFFSVEKGDNCVIAVTDYKKLGKIADVKLKVDKESKEKPPPKAKGILKSVHWSSDWKYMVLIVNQKLKGSFISERDELYPMRFRKRKIRWVEPEEKKEEKEEEEDEPWYKFW